MTQFDQKGQHVGTQHNADTINIGVPFEQYKVDLAEREKEIRQLLVNAALDERDRAELDRQLAQVEQLRLEERGSYEAHVKDLRERIDRLDQLSGQIPDKLISEARQALANGDNAKADQLFTQIEQQADPHIAAAAEAAYQRGKLSKDAIKYGDAFQHFHRAIQLTPDNPEYLATAGNMAGTVANHQKQIEWNEKALAICLKTYGDDHPSVATCRNNLGLAWRSLGQYQKAIAYFDLALVSYLKTYREDHPNMAICRNNLGSAWYSLGQCQEAIAYFDLALASGLKTYGEDHPVVAIRRNNLGSAWRSLGQHQKAIAYYDLALASGLKAYGEDHPDVAARRNNLGVAWYSLGEHQKAIAYFDLALASGLKTYGEDHPKVATSRNNLGLAWDSLGQYQKAIACFGLALATFEKVLGVDHPSTKNAADNLASAMAKQ